MSHKLEVGERRSLVSHYTLTTVNTSLSLTKYLLSLNLSIIIFVNLSLSSFLSWLQNHHLHGSF